MDNSAYVSFLEVWQQIMMIGTILAIAMSVTLFIYHNIKVASIKEYKDKYDYISLYEIKTYKWTFILLGVAMALYSNGYNDETAAKSIIWFFVRFFVAGCIGTLIGYVSALVLEYYYPGKMQKKLDKWRYLPRINPKTGNKMKLLSEDEEDVHLDEGMQAEENVFSIDYDVWIEEATGDTRIERYEGYMEALECNSCGFRTLKVAREEIVQPATVSADGELLKHFECNYCGSKRTTQHNIAKLTNAAAEAEMIRKQTEIQQQGVDENSYIEAIRIQIHQSDGTSEIFEFHAISQAKDFLDEYRSKREAKKQS